MTYLHHNFPANLKVLRLKRGWTQRQLASNIGVSLDTIQNWEQGTRQPSLDRLGTLAAQLGCLPADLVATLKM